MTDSESRPRHPSSKPPKRIQVPWWALTLLGGGVGFVTAEWIGLVFGGVLGFFAWKLR